MNINTTDMTTTARFTPTYNLSNISGFLDFVNNRPINPEHQKFFNIKEYLYNSQHYEIVNYNKSMLSVEHIPTYGLLRSVVVRNDKILSFAPPKSVSADTFIERYSCSATTSLIAEEFIEGTMINVFYDTTFGKWIIATRNTVGGDVVFFKDSNTTFNIMFKEAMENANLKLEKLNQTYCYSFVLQHPKNRIVTPFSATRLYLCAVYHINQQNDEISVCEQDILQIREEDTWRDTNVQFPTQFPWTSLSDMINRFASANTPYTVQGIVIKNFITGERTKIRNPCYEEIRQLKGNHSKMQYQYLSLRKSGKLPEFFKFYPETKKEMSQFREQLHMFTHALHSNYITCYVKKEQPLNVYSPQYKTHMYHLHKHFLNNLRPNKLYISNTEVINYVNNLEPSLLMHSLNYNLRKNNIDIVSADSSKIKNCANNSV